MRGPADAFFVQSVNKLDFRTLSFMWKRASYSYNTSVYGFLICLRLINVWEHIKTLAEKVLKIGEYSRNNQQKLRWRFLNQLRINSSILLVRLSNTWSILYSQCKTSLCWRNTHDVSSLSALWKLLQQPSTKDNERNLCRDLLTIENIDSNPKVQMHALHYANELLDPKLLQTRQTSRNKKKPSKTGVGHD